MEKKIKVGIIGAGGRAGFQTKSILDSQLGEPVIVYSPFEEEAKNFAGKYGIKWTLDVKEIIENPEIDAITISTPNATHYEFSLQGLKNNKNVLVEYPPTLSIEEIENLIEIAKNKNLVYWASLTERLENPHWTIKKLISPDTKFLFTFHSYISPTIRGWYTQPELCGCLYAWQHFHYIDQLIEIFGNIEDVFAFKEFEMNNEGKYVYTYSTLTMEFKNKVISQIEFAMGIKNVRDSIIRFVGKDGIFGFSKGKLYFRNQETEKEIEMEKVNLSEDTFNYLKAIREKKGNWETAEKAKNSLKVALCAEISSKEGRKVKVE